MCPRNIGFDHSLFAYGTEGRGRQDEKEEEEEMGGEGEQGRKMKERSRR